MTGWWRRNAVALGLVVVLVPATVVVVGYNEWSDANVGPDSLPVVVDPGGTLSYAGAKVGPAKSHFVDDDPAAPSGARVVSVGVRMTPGDEPAACLTPTLWETGGGGRQWDEASYELDRDFVTGRSTFCDAEAAGPYTLTLYYLVPDDASGPFAVELESPAERRSARLVIEP